MELSAMLSLTMGLIAGVMFGIVCSKYEHHSMLYDVKVQNPSEVAVHSGKAGPDRIRGLLQYQHPNSNTKAGEISSNMSLEYAVGGTSFYFESEAGGSLKPEQSEIAAWQMFDPQYDAEKLKSALSVFCVITIGRTSIPGHGASAFNSWTKHCNDFVMVSNTENSQFRVKNANLPDGPAKAWERTKMALQYAATNHPGHDWYVKAEFNTFVVLENYRYMLLMHQARIPGFAGHVVASSSNAGSVIALSSATLTKAAAAFPKCGGLYGGLQDFKELEGCLKASGIQAKRDSPASSPGTGRVQMIQAKPDLPLNAHTSVDWAWRNIHSPQNLGHDNCCTDYPISFHNLSPNGLYMMEFAVYHLRPFGIGNYACADDQEPLIVRDQDEAKPAAKLS